MVKFFPQEVDKTVPALIFTHWRLLKLLGREASHNFLVGVGKLSRNHFLK